MHRNCTISAECVCLIKQKTNGTVWSWLDLSAGNLMQIETTIKGDFGGLDFSLSSVETLAVKRTNKCLTTQW